ncbi:MAG: MurR/RpiR family transcriptional regulator [Clostridiaceae bacterium]|jgi:DNA-binding MurR/RpiR family transcriptional regulator|nr:MurR/RpiR family transcriptional regulator [Clostridiaceae bacterium]
MTDDNILCLSRIRQHYELLSNTERRIADLILMEWKRIIDMPVAQIAEEAGVSQATVVRFCRSIGFNGVPELKLYLKREQLSPLGELSEVEIDESAAVVAQKIMRYNKNALDDMLTVLNGEQLQLATDALNTAERVVILSEGGSASTARCAFDVLLQIGMPCSMVEDPFFQIQAAALMKPGEVAFAVCHSGRARNTVESMQKAHEMGATTISIMGLAGSPLSKYTDISLYTGLSGHTFFSETISARICELNVVSALHALLVLRSEERLGDYRRKVSELLNIKRLK